MSDVRELAQEVMRDAFLATLATNDAEGPWAASVIFVADEDLSVYWLSKPASRHSRAIEGGALAAAAITASFDVNDERAIQLEGRAERLLSEPPQAVVEALSKKRGKVEPQSPAELLERDLIWYRLVPSRVELIYLKLFDYERKRVL